MRPKTGIGALPLRGIRRKLAPSNHSPRKDIFLALLVHGVLLLALLGTRYIAGTPSSEIAPLTLRVKLVEIDASRDRMAATGTEPDALAVTGDQSTFESERTSDLDERLPSAVATRVDVAVEIEPDADPLTARQDTDGQAQAAESYSGKAVENEPPVGVDAQERPTAEAPDVPVPDRQQPPDPPAESAIVARVSQTGEPVTAEVSSKQRKAIDRKVRRWVEKLDDAADATPELSWKHDGREYTATLTRVPASGMMGMEQALVSVSARQDGSEWSTQMRMQRLAFSSFAQFVDRWDPRVQIHDDEIDGRFHSNSKIYLADSNGIRPAFHGKVTTSSDITTVSSSRRLRRDEVFLGGLETRVRKILLPKRMALFADGGDEDTKFVHRFDRDVRVEFHADGSYVWTYLQSELPGQRVALTDQPHYLLGSDSATVHVRGVVNGKVLVYTPRHIVIEDDITYAVDPGSDSDSDDFLGLASDSSVEVADPETTGSGDLTIHAAIYAKRRFIVRNYRKREHATLSILGSLAAGSLSATEPRFQTRLTFDERFENAMLPGFPMTNRFEVVEWDEQWIANPRQDSGPL